MRLRLILCILFFAFFVTLSFAESPGIKITQPLDGSIVTPGQEITVAVEAVGGFTPIQVLFVTSFSATTLDSSPFVVDLKIPIEAVGVIPISVSGRSSSRQFLEDEITLNVQQNATLLSLDISANEILIQFDWNGNIEDYYPYLPSVYGKYSDGIDRYISEDPNTTYVSSDPSVISIDSERKFQVHKVGEATITVSNSGVSKVIPVVFEKPRGIPPEETIPPTTTIKIDPSPNSLGWNNSEITITLTATDNEGGSGVKGIYYMLVGMTGKRGIQTQQEEVQGDITEIFVSEEGLARLVYYSEDNELNREERDDFKDFVDICIDKTPPAITVDVPQEGAFYDLNSSIEASWSATDALSGIASATGTVASGEALDTATGGEKIFTVTAVDNADNTSKVTRTYYVPSYVFGGVLPPINEDGSSVFKLGRVVPVKFQLKDAQGNYISTATAKIYLSKISDDVQGVEIEAESPGEANTGNVFRYDATNNQYIFNLGTKSLSVGTWQIKIALDDGSSKYVMISLR